MKAPLIRIYSYWVFERIYFITLARRQYSDTFLLFFTPKFIARRPSSQSTGFPANKWRLDVLRARVPIRLKSELDRKIRVGLLEDL